MREERPEAKLLVPLMPSRTTIKVNNSEFIASIGAAPTVDAARLFIQSIRTEFPDASHHVPAFIVGHGNSTIEHQSDDGEPSGTAGRPVLQVLKGSKLGDAVLVVTRYFGGQKLGTGGLVRAYTDAAKSVLEITRIGRKTSVDVLQLKIPYPFYERIKRDLEELEVHIQQETFAESVTMDLEVETEHIDSVVAFISSKYYQLDSPAFLVRGQTRVIAL